jgi:hypothetical protein
MKRPPLRLLALGAAAAVLAVIVLVSRASHPAGTADPQPDRSSTAVSAGPVGSAASSPDPGGDGDDGSDDISDQPAVITAGPADPREAAVQLLVKILNSQGKTPEVWRAGFRSLVTPQLAGELAEADPANVPVGQVGDRITVAPGGDQLAIVTIPIVTGPDQAVVATAKLTMTGVSHRWLGSELDLDAR